MSNTIPEVFSDGRQRPIHYKVVNRCWIPTTHLAKDGKIGNVLRDGRQQMVHRYVASLFHGEPEDPSLILVRLCGNRMCINPNHMRYKKRPTQTHASKVTEEQILIIKDLLASTDHTMREIGESFGLSIASIKSINRGRTWKHVGYDEYGIPVRPWNDK